MGRFRVPAEPPSVQVDRYTNCYVKPISEEHGALSVSKLRICAGGKEENVLRCTNEAEVQSKQV